MQRACWARHWMVTDDHQADAVGVGVTIIGGWLERSGGGDVVHILHDDVRARFGMDLAGDSGLRGDLHAGFSDRVSPKKVGRRGTR